VRSLRAGFTRRDRRCEASIARIDTCAALRTLAAMPIDKLLLFAGYAMLVTLSPGPDVLTVVARSVAQGARAGLVATLGFATGIIFHTTLAATGLALLLRQSPAAFRVIQYLGAAYLLYLAVRMLLSKEELQLDAPAGERTLRRIYGQSVLMNILNPKVTLFFFAFLSRFGDPNLPWQMILLGAIFAACTLAGFGGCALAAGSLARFLHRRRNAGKVLRGLTAVLFAALAASLLFVRPD
jgi:threonine/homoserine/homoserine lactone efflux protein